MRDDMLGLSISALDRYLGSPVIFLVSFAMRARIIDERVSLIIKMTPSTNAPVNLTKKINKGLKHVVLWTYIACTHCTHRHPRWGLAEISPPNADPRPKENSDENVKRDIGNPRLEQYK
jgi:hypothetical protein